MKIAMIDEVKLEGIVSAIEKEARQPSPSHNELARLVVLFFRSLIETSQVVHASDIVDDRQQKGPATTSNGHTDLEVVDVPEPEPLTKKKGKKKPK